MNTLIALLGFIIVGVSLIGELRPRRRDLNMEERYRNVQLREKLMKCGHFDSPKQMWR